MQFEEMMREFAAKLGLDNLAVEDGIVALKKPKSKKPMMFTED